MKKLFTTFIALVLLSGCLFATNGYLRHGYGVRYSALGGAGTSLSLSSLGVTINPASLAWQGGRFDINAALFAPSRSFTITGNPSGYPGTFGLTPGTVESESDYFVMPTIGASFVVSDNINIGLAFFGNGGMNTDYPTAVFYDQSSPSTGVNLEQMFLAATISYKFNCNHAIGVSLIGAYQKFAAKGLAAFSDFSKDPANLTGNSVDNGSGFGLRIGYLGKILPTVSIGASYQTKFNMSEFERYAGLFAEDGGFDIPSTWNIGISTCAVKDFVFSFDYQMINYSEVKSISNKFNPMALPPAFPDGQGGYVPNPNHAPLGSENGSGFGWEDMNIFRAGVMYKGVEGWDIMFGYSYGENPVKSSEVLFNILAPGIMEHHITFGAAKKLDCGKEISFCVMYAPENTVTGANQFEAPGAQTIELAMSQWQFDLGFSF